MKKNSLSSESWRVTNVWADIFLIEPNESIDAYRFLYLYGLKATESPFLFKII